MKQNTQLPLSDPVTDLEAITLFEVIQTAYKNQNAAFHFDILTDLDTEEVLHHTCTATEVKDIMSGVLAHHRITDAREHVVTRWTCTQFQETLSWTLKVDNIKQRQREVLREYRGLRRTLY